MPNRSQDWLSQAERDLEQAQESRTSGRHEWACFASHQGAHKAVRALHLHLGQGVRGQVISRLLRELPATAPAPEELIDQARILDSYYIPPRYPHSHAEGAPFEHYGPRQSSEAVQYAGEILTFVRSRMA